MKMLIVDDSLIIRKTIERFLGSTYSDVEIVGEASNGIMALEIFQATKPELVTMDITMPEMDGLTCIEAMLKIDPTVKILVVSALSAKETVIEAIKKGAKGYVLKPFTEDKLKAALEEII